MAPAASSMYTRRFGTSSSDSPKSRVADAASCSFAAMACLRPEASEATMAIALSIRAAPSREALERLVDDPLLTCEGMGRSLLSSPGTTPKPQDCSLTPCRDQLIGECAHS